ncbi:CO/xanthine dehydrogenase FAD-binding subunit [Bacillus niacini]|uniref:CO/xanthine dehydrogenase FAD-binding subunit n=1 Tax=Neobacillus niacini TaxID=86668 RepID=A0A852TKI7_9BACI|nr:FAD binding domain-containing protein [Neobacillus niacini]NYE08691.1 CO/xanthine dehydrogenase FAD-binding subunit [Neobacillus niacini]
MLAGNIEYYQPSTVNEAVEQFFILKKENKLPMYYAGGTEILTLGRLNIIHPGAIIDIKAIKETLSHESYQEHFIFGASLPLTYIEEKNIFPLLTQTSMEIADHTARNKITIGGNVCGNIFYREAVLPFLLCDSTVVVAGKEGQKTHPIQDIFNKTFQFEEGQFLIQLLIEKKYLTLPFITIKKRQQWETGYPLITVACIKIENQLRFAFSGLCPFPFRSQKVETELNNTLLPKEERINHAIEQLPTPVLNDVEGSKEYRLFVLRNTLKEMIVEMEEKE